MKIKLKRKNYAAGEKIFLCIWAFYSLTYVFLDMSELRYMYDISTLYKATSYITFFLMAVLILFYGRYSVKEMLIYALFVFMIILIEISITDRAFLVNIMFIIYGKNIELKKLVSFDIKLKIIMLFIIVGLCLAGILDNYSAVINGTYKQAMGFSHPNTLTCFVLIILIEWLYLRYEELKVYDFAAQACLCWIVMQVGGGRSSGYTYIIVLGLFLVAKLYPQIFRWKITRAVFVIIVPVMVFLCFLVARLYQAGNGIILKLDHIATGRIKWMSYFLNNYNIKLFGQEIVTINTRKALLLGTSYMSLDNAYIRCVLTYGVLYLILVCIAYIFLMNKALEMDQPELALCCLFFVILGLGETYMLNVLFNVTLLCLLGLKNDVPNLFRVEFTARKAGVSCGEQGRTK